jgi:hypothetical protein
MLYLSVARFIVIHVGYSPQISFEKLQASSAESVMPFTSLMVAMFSSTYSKIGFDLAASPASDPVSLNLVSLLHTNTSNCLL